MMEMNKRKRILMTVPWSPFGIAGAERSVSTLANALGREFDVLVLVISPLPAKLDGVFISEVNVKNIVSTRARFSVGKIAACIRSFNPDSIIGHVSHVSTNTLLAKIMSGSKARFVSVNHGVDMKNAFEILHVYVNYLLSDTYVVVSEGMRDSLANLPFIKKKRVLRIYNGIDFKKTLKRANEDMASNEVIWDTSLKTVVGVGRFVSQKSFGVLIRAIRRYQDVYEKKINLILIGCGEEEKTLKELVTSLGLKGSVYFLGWKDNPLPFMREADVFALSSYFEGFGYVLVEALACGTSVVSTDCPSGPAEILEQGLYGRLVPVGNVDALARGIESILQQPISSHALIDRARDFSSDHMILKYRDILKN